MHVYIMYIAAKLKSGGEEDSSPLPPSPLVFHPCFVQRDTAYPV